jgi:uncharacterized membrane protein YidH (DUF202 family)
VKNLAFVFAVLILATGVTGVFVPEVLVRITNHAITSDMFYVIATVRIGFGLILVSVASMSRAPRALKILGYVILIVGVATAVTGLVAMEQAKAILDWWLQQGLVVMRLTSGLLLVLGGFIAYACAPARRTSA